MFLKTFRKKTRISPKRRGAAIVEMAFVVIILLALTLGLIQWGIIFNASISITNLSREAARYAAVHPETDAGIQTYVSSNPPPGIRAQDLTVTVVPSEADPNRKTKGMPIRVIVRYNMARKLFLPARMFAAPYTITFFSGTYRAEGQMMIEG